jgi:hypothetical protein
MAYILYAGAAKRTARRAALAGAVVAGESLIFTVNRRDRTSCSVPSPRTANSPSKPSITAGRRAFFLASVSLNVMPPIEVARFRLSAQYGATAPPGRANRPSGRAPKGFITAPGPGHLGPGSCS